MAIAIPYYSCHNIQQVGQQGAVSGLHSHYGTEKFDLERILNCCGLFVGKSPHPNPLPEGEVTLFGSPDQIVIRSSRKFSNRNSGILPSSPNSTHFNTKFAYFNILPLAGKKFWEILTNFPFFLPLGNTQNLWLMRRRHTPSEVASQGKSF